MQELQPIRYIPKLPAPHPGEIPLMSDPDDLFAALENNVSRLKTVAKDAARKTEAAKSAKRELAATGTGGAEDALYRR